MATDHPRSTLARSLDARARSKGLALLGAPLLLLGTGLWLLHLRNAELAEASCQVTASEELGWLTVRLELEVAGKRHRSPVIASCRRPEERARGCGQGIGARVPCHYFTVEPEMVFGERPRLPSAPTVPGLFVVTGGLLLIWALILRLRASAVEAGGAGQPSWTPILAGGRSIAGVILGGALLLAGLGLCGLALSLLWTSSSLHPGFGHFALLAGLGAALLGSWLGFSRSELLLDAERGLLQRRLGLFSPFWRRCYGLEAFRHVRVEEVRGKTAKGGAFRSHYLVLDPAQTDGTSPSIAERPQDASRAKSLRIYFPDEEAARRAASQLQPLLGGR